MSSQGLESRKTRALSAMLCSRSVEEAAELAGVSSTTIFRWLRDDEHFQSEYRKSSSQVMEVALRRLKQICSVATETLASVMADGEAAAASRVTAARATLELTLKIDERLGLMERVERLEARLGKGKTNAVY
jgi:ubiquinone biosynthesis protein UbiJ